MSYKSQIDEVIDAYGTIIELVPTTTTTNDYGDVDIIEGSPISVKSVPYNYVFLQDTFQKMGLVQKSEQYFILKGDQDVDDSYHIIFDGKHFKINRVEKYILQGVTLAKLVVVSQAES